MTDLELDEINERVAKAMGWILHDHDVRGYEDFSKGDPRIHWHKPGKVDVFLKPYDYSRSIEAAWNIVEKGYVSGVWKDIGSWVCGTMTPPLVIEESRADTAPLAICKAFLKLKEGE